MPPIDYVPLWEDPLHNLSIVILPAITIGYRYSAVTMRMTRSAMLEVLREDYIRTARAKGLLEQLIVNRHALKNAMLPVVTLVGIEFAFLIGGLVVTEQVFNLNGIGRLFVLAVQNQDYTLTQALVMLTVAIFVVDQPGGRRAVRVARSAHPLRLRRAAMTAVTNDPPAVDPPLVARCVARRGHFARRQPLGTFGLVDRHHRGSPALSAEWIAPYSPTANDFAAMTEPPERGPLAGHRPVRPGPAVAHHLRRAHRPDRRLRLGASSAASWASCWASPAPISAAGSTTSCSG